eukprot:12392795-Ditylum_brightwellii.AAC.1
MFQPSLLYTWPGLTAKRIQKHLDKNVATGKGHLTQQRKNLRSTSPQEKPVIVDLNKLQPQDDFNIHETITSHTNMIFAST